MLLNNANTAGSYKDLSMQSQSNYLQSFEIKCVWNILQNVALLQILKLCQRRIKNYNEESKSTYETESEFSFPALSLSFLT